MQIIEAGKISQDYWKNLWRRRELLYFLARRDLVVRYKQTFVGVGWVAIRPFLTMVVFTIIFGSIAQLDSNGLPYGFVVFAGVVPWFLFANTLTDTSNCLQVNTGMLTKVYFPRLIFPSAIFVVAIVDCLVSCVILFGLMIWYQIVPSWQMIFFPYFIFLAAIFGVGLGLIGATLNAKYRDFQQIIPFTLQLGIYLSPVGYLNSLVSKKWEIVYAINPMAGIINGFRWCLVPESIPPYWPGIALASAICFGIFLIGIKAFRAAEDSFADTI
jgi:lipopolysaccharide transport system permease protein